MTDDRDPVMRPEEARTIRFVLFVAAAVNIMFWVARARLDLGQGDPLRNRLLLSAACGAGGAAAGGGARARRCADAGMQVLAYAGTVWWTHKVAASGLQPDFAVGSLLPPAIVGLLFRRPGQHLVYALFSVVIAAVEYESVPAPSVPPWFLLLCLATVLGVMHLPIRTRLRTRADLDESRDLVALLAAQTTEAMILLDPARRAAFEANGRARSLFGIGPDGNPGPLWEAVGEALGAEGWGGVQRNLEGERDFRARGSWTAPGGLRFGGELTVTRERVGRREVLLARLADASHASIPASAGPVAGGAKREGGEAFRAEELRMYRAVLLTCGALLPGFWVLRRVFSDVASVDPLWHRLATGAACVAVGLAAGGPAWARSLVRPGVAVVSALVSLWWIHLVALTGLRPDYAAGLLMATAIIGGGLHRPLDHMIFGVLFLAVAALAFSGLPAPGVSPAFVLLCLGTMLGMTHFLLRAQLATYGRLLASEDLGEIMFERTAEALVLADPLRSEILACNGRARTLLGAQPGGCSLGPVVAGTDELRLRDLLAIQRETAEHGTYRRELAYA
ncbi:MAG: hypothetical protein AAB368_10405, partial [bacterium]